MARSCYSTVLEQPADEVWSVIRDFNNYSVWPPNSESRIEGGRAGDAVGAIRNVRIGDRTIRQRLLAHSDLDRSQTYEYCEPVLLPVRNYQATLRVAPVVDGNRSFVEWRATFDCAPEEYDRWTTYFTHEGFAQWLRS